MLLRDRASVTVMIVFALLVGWSSWQGGARVQERRGLDVQARSAADARLADALERGATAVLAGGQMVRPVAILSPLALGGLVDRQAGPTRVEATAAPLLQAPARDALDAEAQAAGPLDLLFVLVQLFPLLVIALAYDILSGDRERGTLGLLLSQPLHLRDLLAAKALARLLALAAVGVVASTVAWASGAVSLGGGDVWGDLAWMTAMLLLWMAFWFAAALAVNAWGHTSSGNALALTTLWLVLVVVGPGLMRAGVEAAYPPPSRVALATAARDAAKASEQALEAIEGDHRAGTEQPAPGMDGGKTAAERELLARLTPLRRGFEVALGRQQQTIDQLRVLSPALTTSEALVALAGEDVARRRAWHGSVERWHEQLRAWFAEERDRGGPARLADMPTIAPHDAPAAELTDRLAADLAFLALWTLLAVGIAVVGLRREVGRRSHWLKWRARRTTGAIERGRTT